MKRPYHHVIGDQLTDESYDNFRGRAVDDEIRASHKPKPPKRIGREVCNQAASEIEDWVILPWA